VLGARKKDSGVRSQESEVRRKERGLGAGGRFGVLAKPRLKAIEPEIVGFIELHQESIRFEIIEFQTKAINSQESRSDRNGGPLVSVDEWVVLGKALEQCRSLLDDVPVVAALRSGQGCIECATVANPLCAAEQDQQAGVRSHHVIETRINCHWASRRSNSGCSEMNSSMAAWKAFSGCFPWRCFRKTMNSFTADCSSGESSETS
jgi:hypothetical protein